MLVNTGTLHSVMLWHHKGITIPSIIFKFNVEQNWRLQLPTDQLQAFERIQHFWHEARKGSTSPLSAILQHPPTRHMYSMYRSCIRLQWKQLLRCKCIEFNHSLYPYFSPLLLSWITYLLVSCCGMTRMGVHACSYFLVILFTELLK